MRLCFVFLGSVLLSVNSTVNGNNGNGNPQNQQFANYDRYDNQGRGQHSTNPGLNNHFEQVSTSPSSSRCRQGIVTNCHSQASCVDYRSDHCCECNPGFYGNGRVCLQEGAEIRMNGKVEGVLNGVTLNDSDLSSYIVPKDGRSYTSITKISEQIGYDLQTIITLGTSIGWLFSTSVKGAPNGVMLTGGVFNYTSNINFYKTGRRVQIHQQFLGLDALSNNMRVETRINGTTPIVPIGKEIEVKDIEMEFTRVSPGIIRSNSMHAYTVGENQPETLFSVDQYIEYEECPRASTDRSKMNSVTMKVGRNYIVYELNQQIARYSVTSNISHVEGVPMIWVQNQLVGAPVGTNVTLECHTEGFPRVISYWVYDDMMLLTNKKYTTEIIQTNNRTIMRLTVKNLSDKDFGRYICLSKNSVGETEGSIRLYDSDVQNQQIVSQTERDDTRSVVVEAPYSRESADIVQGSQNDDLEKIQSLPQNITLIVMGRSGMGVSSTVRELIGKNKTIIQPTGPKSPVKEILIPIPSHPGKFLKIVDVEGVVDGKSFTDDATTISSIIAYLNNPEGLNGTLPNFFLVITNFDDSRLQGNKSLFTELLNRVSMVQNSVYNTTTSNTLFLLTRLMSVTKATQRRPAEKIMGFRDTIRLFSSFREPLHIAVGENHGVDNELQVEDGYTKLPNKERYPENVYNILLNISQLSGDNETINMLNSVMDNRQNPGQIISEYFREANPPKDQNSKGDILSELHGHNSGTENTEINSALQMAFEKLDNSLKSQMASRLNELKRHFQSTNLRNLTQLPQTTLERVRFFQNIPGINSQKVNLINQAFNLSMPELLLNPVVGYGFDLTQDAPMEVTPFVSGHLRPSQIGYLTPDFITCSKIPPETDTSTKDFAVYVGNISNYVSVRYQYLELKDPQDLSNMTFGGTVKFGFNLEPETPTSVVSLSALQEIRTLECQLNDGNEFTKEFKTAINALTPFNEFDRNSPKLWRAFFNEYGTHVVSRVYGGGYREGFVIGRSLRQVIESEAKINDTLEGLLNFDNSKLSEKPSYRYFGGSKDPSLEFATNLNKSERDLLMTSWVNSLDFDPIILLNDLILTPMDVYAKLVNFNMGLEVKRAADLLLRGQLIYKRRVRPATSRPVKPTPSKPATTTLRYNYWPPPTESITTTERSIGIIEPTTTKNPSTFDNSEISIKIETTTRPYRQHDDSVGHNTLDSFSGNEQSAHHDSDKQTGLIDSSSKQQDKDYISNTLGQSYHLLKELVLPRSPFVIGDLIASTQNKEIEPCMVGRYKTFTDTSDYLRDRWTYSFNIISHPPNPSQFFVGEVMEGNMIPGDNSNNDMEYVEVRTDYTELKKSDKLMTSLTFQDDLYSLPSFHYYDLPDCRGKQKWLKFFEKYGTHYVSAFYSGYTFDRDIMPDEKSGYSSPNKPTCVPCYNGKGSPPTPTRGIFQTDISDNWGFTTPVKPKLKKCDEAAVISVGGQKRLSTPVKVVDRIKSSYTFISYSDYYARKNLTLSQSIDEAMYQLIDNKLTC